MKLRKMWWKRNAVYASCWWGVFFYTSFVFCREWHEGLWTIPQVSRHETHCIFPEYRQNLILIRRSIPP